MKDRSTDDFYNLEMLISSTGALRCLLGATRLLCVQPLSKKERQKCTDSYRETGNRPKLQCDSVWPWHGLTDCLPFSYSLLIEQKHRGAGTYSALKSSPMTLGGCSLSSFWVNQSINDKCGVFLIAQRRLLKKFAWTRLLFLVVIFSLRTRPRGLLLCFVHRKRIALIVANCFPFSLGQQEDR